MDMRPILTMIEEHSLNLTIVYSTECFIKSEKDCKVGKQECE